MTTTRINRWCFCYTDVYGGSMATDQRRTRSGGRPGKGDRHAFALRRPREYAEQVIRYADATGSSYNDVLADLVARHLDELDTEAVELGTNRLNVEVKDRTA